MKLTFKKVLIIIAVISVTYYLWNVYKRHENYSKSTYSTTSNYDDFGRPSCDKNVNRIDNYPVLIEGYGPGDRFDMSGVTAHDYKTDYVDPIDLSADVKGCAFGDNPYACSVLNGTDSHYIL